PTSPLFPYTTLFRSLQGRTTSENYCSLNQVFQFADVSRPVPACQLPHTGSGNRFDLLLHAAGVLLGEVTHQQRNVLRTLTQRRNLNGKDVEPVIKVAAELVFRDHLFQVAVG